MMRLHNSSIVIVVCGVVVNRHTLKKTLECNRMNRADALFGTELLLLLINYESMAENWFCSSQTTSKCKLHSHTHNRIHLHREWTNGANE